MTTPPAKALDRSASKRARSSDSSRSGTATPHPKALKTQDGERGPDNPTEISVPAFLRLSAIEIRAKFGELEYKQLLRISEGRRDPTSKWLQQVTRESAARNRYSNIQPWDRSRIHLEVANGDSDYINASPIALEDPRTGAEFTYIASQGPKKTGLSHFWHMTWQQTSDVAVVVMLTQFAEGGREKCYQYFPLNTEDEMMMIDPQDRPESPQGRLVCSEVSFDNASRSTVRKLLLSYGEETRVVWHLLFSGWPDFEVPQYEDRAALLELLKLSAEKNTGANNPRIIHCSAGVGRSGSFIALEFLLAQIETGAIMEARDDEDLIYDVVNRLREQRMTMVQSDAQYAFLYETVREQFVKYKTVKQASQVYDMASDIKAALQGEGVSENGHVIEGEPTGEDAGKAPDTS